MIVARFLLFATLLLLVGSVVVAVWIVPRAGAEGSPTALRVAAAGLAALTAAGVVVALGGLFAAQLFAFRDPFVPWTEDAAILLSTPWGRLWTAAVAVAGGTAAAWGWARVRWRRGGPPGRTAPVVGLLGAGALAFFPGSVGHAAGVEGLGPLAVMADGLHVLGGGVWLGGLAAVLLLARGTARPALARLIPAFSPVALAAGGLVLATGAFASWLHVGSPSALVGSEYGRRLLLKLGLVAGVLVLGALHWRRWAPRLRRDGAGEGTGGDPGTPGPLGRRTAGLEVALGVGILLATAWLLGTSPP